MKRNTISLISIIITLTMLLSVFAACAKKGDSPSSPTEAQTTVGTEAPTEAQGNGTEKETDAKATEAETDGKTTEVSETKADETAEETEIHTSKDIDCSENELVENANALSNKVNAYYTNADTSLLTVENANTSLDYTLDGAKPQYVNALKNSAGKAYIENTMDVFVKMASGNVYYASEGLSSATMNLFRLGYYFYDVHIEGQSFIPAANVVGEKNIPLEFKSHKDVSDPKLKDGIISVVQGVDPYLVFDNIDFNAADYEYLQVTLKCDSMQTNRIDIYLLNDDMTAYTDNSRTSFMTVSDGEYHTYTILLSTVGGYTGHIKGLRIDYAGSNGTVYNLKEAKLLDVDAKDAPASLNLARYFETYSDKLHHYAQLTAASTTTDIAEVGAKTVIDASTVAKYVIKDTNGLHYDTLDVDWATAEYAGFDIKDVGVFGYILPVGEYGGKLEITLEGGKYVLIQTLTVPDGTINPSPVGTNNANDFYFGQRLYTDEGHDLQAFINEADAERNPLTKANIFVDLSRDSAKFLGYDALRGFYAFSVAGTNFGEAYNSLQNKHYAVNFTVTGDSYDRTMYCRTYTTSGGLEGAVLLDSNDLLLPIPMEVCKNFYGDGDQTTFCTDDPSFGETYFPIFVNAGQKVEYTVLNLYQNWGQYPLKQISSIQFIYPYYHLSTGVTETNCIVPYAAVGPWLPDHRAMSAPMWASQPQHTLGGFHYFLRYTDADGNYSSTENSKNTIISSGPTYAEVKMDFVSHDGRMTASYTHMEMPQLDENRGYYVMEYEVLEDISFKDFKNDFFFYSVRQNNTGGRYEKIGYLDENNQSQVADAVKGKKASYVLGDVAPYFDFFYVSNYTNENGYVNLSFLISDYSLTIGGEKSDARFIVTYDSDMLYLSLNLGEVTLKAGDKIKIKAILMPWGSQETIYDGSNGKAPDQNVRDVRENSILDPLKAEANKDCKVLKSDFLPKLMTTNGKTAEFTISGGENNSTFRVYGFHTLTAPRLFEQIDGKWVEIELSSINTPDKNENCAYYDGYMVHYDGDGTFSYSFVTNLTGDESKTFRLVCSQEFTGWPEIEGPEEEDPINVYVSATEINKVIGGNKGVGSFELRDDDGAQFVRIYGNNKTTEGHFTPYKAAKLIETGKYLVIKYRVPTTNAEKLGSFEIFCSTENDGPMEGDNFLYAVSNDGQWHVVVIDVSVKNPGSFKAAEDELFYARYFRIDFFDKKMSETSYIDIAYIGMCNSIDTLRELNSDMERLSLVTNKEVYISTATGEEVSGGGSGGSSGEDKPTVEIVDNSKYIDASSGYTSSTVMYASCIDMLNGKGYKLDGGDYQDKFPSVGSSSIKAVNELDYEVYAISSPKLVLSGWTIAEGGIDKYVFSADGGKTWIEMRLSGGSKPSDAPTADYVKSASTRLGGYVFADETLAGKCSCYQGTKGAGEKAVGLAADLSAYAGQTVNVTIAAVPTSAPDTLCIITHVVGYEVPAAN